MIINYEIDSTLAENEIIIKCRQLSSKFLEIERILNSSAVDSVFGVVESKIFPIKSSEIERIYTENRKVVIYSNGKLYESNKTLSKTE